MTGWILLVVYILGFPCWVWVEKRFDPFQKEDYTLDYDREGLEKKLAYDEVKQ